MAKKFAIKIYNKSATFQKNLSEDIIESDISFTQQINGGQGELLIDLAIPFDDIPSYIALFNFVRVYEVDTSNPTGRLIYTGWVSQVVPFSDGSRNGVRVICLGLVSLLTLSKYKDGASFDVAQSSVDPSAIIADIISTFQTAYPPSAGFEWIGTDAVTGIRAGSNVDAIGTNVTYTFQKLNWRDAIDIVFGLSDPGWYWFVDAGGDFFFKEKSATPDHTFVIGRNIQSIEVPKSIEEIINDVTVAYNGGTQNATDATSITAYGIRAEYIDRTADTNDATTALQIATKEVEDNKISKVEARMTINNTYDIESIRPGQTCQVLNYKKDANLFESNMLIVSTSYKNGDSVELRLESKKDIGTELGKFVDAKTS
jgi:hypothetical protein